MNFDLDEKESSLITGLREAIDKEAEKRLKYLRSSDPLECLNLFMDYLTKLAGIGYLAIGVRDGKNSTVLVAAQEELASLSPSLFLSIEYSTRIFGRLIAGYGTSHQQDAILPPLEQGRHVGSVALTEGGMSVENEGFKTTAAVSGNGFLISGSKDHVINGTMADRTAVVAQSGEKLMVVLVKTDSAGVHVGERYTTIGYEGTPAAPLHLDGVLVPSEQVMGPFEPPDILKNLRRWEDQVLISASLGLMKRSFESALDHAKKHMRGGKPIIAYQEVGFKLAEMLTLRQTAQLLAHRSAWMDETGDRERDVLVNCAKAFCTESAEQVASQALQILGGKGLIKGNPAEESYGSAKYLQVAGTSSEITRVKIGDSILERV
jgi:alkylation response protein AidB-like acyl-CoA dehydrogenase